jgi:hypothetical protein
VNASFGPWGWDACEGCSEPDFASSFVIAIAPRTAEHRYQPIRHLLRINVSQYRHSLDTILAGTAMTLNLIEHDEQHEFARQTPPYVTRE